MGRASVQPEDGVIGPAVVTDRHVQDRSLSRRAGTRKGWSRLSVIAAAFLSGKMSRRGEGKVPASRRYAAALKYSEIWDAAQPPTKDSTQAMNVSGGGFRLIQGSAHITAARRLDAIHKALGCRDRRIVEMVCGQDYEISAAIRAASGHFTDEVTNRFREALDSLDDVLTSLGYI
jgi:hypothetical protein